MSTIKVKKPQPGRQLSYVAPDVAKDWHPMNNGLTPNDVSAGSNYMANWCCQTCGYEWTATVKSRVRGNGCPACAIARRNRIMAARRANK